MKLTVKRLDPDLPLLSYASQGDAGLDLRAAHEATLKPGERALIGTGIALAIPEGYAGFVLARSGRAVREGFAVVNAPGLIDSGYRGEVKVAVINLDPYEPIHIVRGDKIAQLVIQRVEEASLVEVEQLPPSGRGEGGFGSTGR